MNDFMYYNPVRVHFGADAMSHLPEELGKFGANVLLTYGGGGIKRTGLYDRVLDALRAAGKSVYELSGIMTNPRTEKRCTRASSFAGSIRSTSFLPSAAAARSTAPRPSPWEHRRRATSGKSFM